MEISELVIQGVRGFDGVVRLALAPQITVVVPSQPEQGQTVLDVLVDLLNPPGAEPSLTHLVQPQAEACRVGTTLQGRSGETFRILRDLRSGKTSLLKQQGEAMTPVTEQANEVGQVVTSQVGFPQVDVVRRLFMTTKGDLPSQRTDLVAEVTDEHPVAPGGSMHSMSGVGEPVVEKKPMMPLPPGFGDFGPAPDEFSHLSDDEKRAKLADIEQQLTSMESVQDLEFELDGLQKKGFELEEKLRPLENLRHQLQTAEERAAAVGEVKEVPDDFREQVQSHLAHRNAHQSSQQELERKIEKMRDQYAMRTQASRSMKVVLDEAMEEPLLKYGLLAGVGFTLLGVVGAVAFEPLRAAAYGNIAGFFVALVGGWKVVSEAEHLGRARGQVMRLQRDFEKADSRFELDESSFNSMLARYGLASDDLGALDEVISRAEEAKEAKAAVAAARQNLADAEAEVPADVQQEQTRIQARLKELEEQLFKAGGYQGDTKELKAQKEALEKALSGETEAAPPPADDAFGMFDDGPSLAPDGSVDVAGGAKETYDDVTRKLLDAGSDIFFTDLDSVASMVEPRVAQMLGGLTDQRYTRVVFHPRGQLGLVEAMSGQEVGFKDLTPGDKDLVYLALKLSIVEAYVKKNRMPVFFDGVFDGFPDARDTLHARILQFLGNATQVVCVTHKPALMAISPHRLQL